MNLLLLRKWYFPNATIGELFIQRLSSNVCVFDHECYTLEDHFPTPYIKRPRLTAIPEGEYEIKVTDSPRFGVKMPLLLHVPQFQGIRIHWGNRSEDTDGCILVGVDKDLAVHEIMHSVAAYEALLKKLKAVSADERILINIKRDGT